jgi:hypothetical protein
MKRKIICRKRRLETMEDSSELMREFGGISNRHFLNNEIVMLQLSESNETLGGTIRGMLPFIDLGFRHISYEDYNHVYLVNEDEFSTHPPTFTKEEIDKILSLPPNSPVKVRDNLEPVVLYYFTIE